MKKITLTLIALLGLTVAMKAQETQTTTTTTTITTDSEIGRTTPRDRFNFYYGFGINVLGDYKINDKLKASGVPTIGNAAPEFTFGLNFVPTGERFYHDLEFSVAYMNDKTATDRLKTIVSSFRLRPQYKFIDKEKLFFSAGLDLGVNSPMLNLYRKGTTIDLNDLNPGAHTGHINMYSTQFILGPSIALGLFQKVCPIRINAGYNIGLSRGRWKSDVASVANTLSESGLGNFYAKLSIGF